MLNISIGTWVAGGDMTGSFLMAGVSALIHFGVIDNSVFKDPTMYMSNDTIVELLAMVQSFHPGWQLSYP